MLIGSMDESHISSSASGTGSPMNLAFLDTTNDHLKSASIDVVQGAPSLLTSTTTLRWKGLPSELRLLMADAVNFLETSRG